MILNVADKEQNEILALRILYLYAPQTESDWLEYGFVAGGATTVLARLREKGYIQDVPIVFPIIENIVTKQGIEWLEKQRMIT